VKERDSEQNMYYDEEFIGSLPEDHQRALLYIASAFDSHWESNGLNTGAPYGLVRETHALLAAYLEREGLSWVYIDSEGAPVVLPEISGSPAEDISQFEGFIRILQTELGMRVNRDDHGEDRQRFNLMLGTAGFHYQFSEGDIDRIQKLVNELRNLIAASEELREEHKRRVLGRLERLQRELHKKMSDLSVLWGVLIEASMVARRLGQNAKPIVDRIREIASIAGPTQARNFGLPSNTPFTLPGQVEDKESPKN
jgi:hypothetical protein